MRILILSQHPWRKDNSFGNTYSNIWGKVDNIEIAHIYLMDGLPDYEPVVTRYYQISEGAVMSSFFKRSRRDSIGREVVLERDNDYDTSTTVAKSWYSYILSFGRRHHWRLLFWFRELAWKYGNVNYVGMMDFIKSFQPDIFVLPYFNEFFTNRIALYIKDRIDVPMVLEMAMDHYTLNRVSYNPFFWIDRFIKRGMIRTLVQKSSFMFVISPKMKEEFEKVLDVECKVLYKTPDRSRQLSTYNSPNNPVQFLFTGNIYANRWKSLALLARELEKQKFGRLDIYTATPITQRMRASLEIPNVSFLHSPVSQDEVINLQNKADVLVHAEAFDRFNKSLVRCAISTKIMDYLCVGRCILAIGPHDISSIEYLKKDNLALVASDLCSLSNALSLIKNDSSIIKYYANQGLHFCETVLNASSLRNSLYDSLEKAIRNYNPTSVRVGD